MITHREIEEDILGVDIIYFTATSWESVHQEMQRIFYQHQGRVLHKVDISYFQSQGAWYGRVFWGD